MVGEAKCTHHLTPDGVMDYPVGMGRSLCSPEAKPLNPLKYGSGILLEDFPGTSSDKGSLSLWSTVVDPQHRKMLQAEIIGLLRKGVPSRRWEQDKYVSHYFLIPKQDRGLCPLFDLSLFPDTHPGGPLTLPVVLRTGSTKSKFAPPALP